VIADAIDNSGALSEKGVNDLMRLVDSGLVKARTVEVKS
jgi:hypothetical protein